MNRTNDRTAHPPLGPLRATPPERLFTPAALERAWLAVRRAGGGPGVDGVSLRQFDRQRTTELAALRQALVGGRYVPQPVRIVMVPKTSGGLRSLALWALRDRVAQRVVYEIIAPVFESEFLPCSFGFRPGLGAHDAVAALQRYRDAGLRWVIHADIADCFDRLDPPRLLSLVAARVQDQLLLAYIRGWLQAKILNSADGIPRLAGASQGSVLSPLLANIYLHQVDALLVAQGLAYLRYADDFVICCQRKATANLARQAAQPALARWGLALNERKTHLVHFDNGFVWLGYFLLRRECYRLKPTGAASEGSTLST